MQPNLTIYFSNRLDVLYENLKFSLFRPGTSPFSRRIVVVYGPAMKSWLNYKMASDPDLGVAAGVEFLYLNQAFEALGNHFQKTSEGKKRVPTLLEMTLAIESHIRRTLLRLSSFSPAETEEWLPLLKYLKIEKGSSNPFSPKVERRLAALCQHLAVQFQNYGRFAEKMTAEWQKKGEGWQARLWEALFESASPWTYLSESLNKPVQIPHHCQIHFFSISYTARCEFAFLERLSGQIGVSYYLLSPCALFWSDIKSDRERSYLEKVLQKKKSVSLDQQEQLEEWLRDRNPLLANFGKLGREMALQIEESGAAIRPFYLLPKWSGWHNDIAAEDLHYYAIDGTPSLLQVVQEDMLLLRNPADFQPLLLEKVDDSIQLHLAPNRRREVEILFQNLLKIMGERAGLEPQDIIVMAPQILDYVPYIRTVFGNGKGPLDFQILDLGLQTCSELVQGFLHLLELSQSRWEASAILQLFDSPSFMRRHHWTPSDYFLIKDWIVQATIRWGDDPTHRNEILQRRHCVKGMVEEQGSGTWKAGLNRLLEGLAKISDHADGRHSSGAIEIDFAQSELLEGVIECLQSLKDDLAPLHDGTKMGIEEWSNYLGCLLDQYFQPDFKDPASIESLEELKAQFALLKHSSKHLEEAGFSFHSIKIHLADLLQKKEIVYRENHLQSIRFCSLVPLRSIPARVIALLGMEAGAFPRVEYPSSLNLAQNRSDVSYRPSKTDYDRYLFLEVLHAAQDILLMSYSGFDPKDRKEVEPSLAVQELLSYLDSRFLIAGKKGGSACLYRHPFDGFDPTYFQSDSSFVNFCENAFKGAVAVQLEGRKNEHRFIQAFEYSEKSLQELIASGSVIDINHLTEVARHPIKFHLNRILEIYLKDDQETNSDLEELQISHLDKNSILKSSFKRPFEKVYQQFHREGKLPLGLFKEAAAIDLKSEIDEIRQCLKQNELLSEDFFTIEFSESCLAPEATEKGNWLYPPLCLADSNGHEVKIVGELPYVSSKGYFIFAKNGQLSEIWKFWPQFLIFCLLSKRYPDQFEPHLYISGLKTAKKELASDPETSLMKFLRYYGLCREGFSPLMPEFLNPILSGDRQELEKKLQSLLAQEYQRELKWSFNARGFPESGALIGDWQTEVESLAGELSKKLSRTKKGEE